MRYRRWKTTKNIAALALPAIPVALGVLLLATGARVPSFMTDALTTASTPVWDVRDSIIATVVATYESLESKDALLRENTALYNEISALRRESFMARVLARENEELRAMVGRVPEAHTLLAVSVINSDVFTPYDTFVVDAGEQEGVREGMLVLTPEGFAVGTVARVQTASALVRRFSSSGINVDVVVQGTSSVHARMEGQGSGTMVLTVPRDVPIGVGDVVTLPNLTGNPLGEVSVVEVQPEDAYQTVYVESSANMYTTRLLFIDVLNVWNADDAIRDTESERAEPV